MNLGKVIKDIRKKQAKPQGEFAQDCGITQSYLSQIESDQKEPSLTILKIISEKLNVPLPIIFFLSLNEKDVPVNKRKAFEMIGPSIKSLINEFFTV